MENTKPRDNMIRDVGYSSVLAEPIRHSRFNGDVQLLTYNNDYSFTADGVQLIDCQQEELVALFEHWLKREAGTRFLNSMCFGRRDIDVAMALMHHAYFYENQINPRVARYIRKKIYAEEVANSRAFLASTELPENDGTGLVDAHRDWIKRLEKLIATIDSDEAKCECESEWCDCPFLERCREQEEERKPTGV